MMRLLLTILAALGFASAALGASKEDMRAACIPLVKDAVARTLAKPNRYLTLGDAAVINNCASQVDAATVVAPAPQPLPSADIAGIVASMRPGEFRAVSKNTLKDVGLPNRPGCGWGDAGSILEQWGGAAFDTKRGRLLINGGGHNAYCGNEVYAFDLGTLLWTRETDPSPLVADQAKSAAFGCTGVCAFTTADQSPVSYHSYDTLVYLPNVDRMFVAPNAAYFIGYSYDNAAYLYDPAGKKWTRGPKPAPNAYPGCDFWPKTGEALCSSSDGLVAFNPVTNAWRSVRTGEDSSSGQAGAIDTDANVFWQIGRKNPYTPGTAPLVSYDLNVANPPRTLPTVAGNTEFAQVSLGSGIAYDPTTRRMAIWAGGPEVWACDKAPSCVKYASPTGPAYLPSYNGVWGKWQYVPALNVFIGVRLANEPVYLYRLPKPGEVVGDATQTPQETISLQALVDKGGNVSFPAGTYRQAIVVDKPSVIEGNGAKLIGTAAQGKGAIILNADTTVRNLTVTDLDGGDNLAAIRISSYGSVSAVIDGLTAQRVQTGLLTVAEGGTITMRNSSLLDILGGEYGRTHGVYVGCGYDYTLNKYKTCSSRHDTFNSQIRRVGKGGHTFKSRAPAGTIDHTVLAQEGADSSRSVDLSFGGAWSVVCSVIQHGNQGNDDVIAHGPEGIGEDNRAQSLLIDRSVIINDRPGAILYRYAKATPVVKNSVLVGVTLPAEADGGGNKLFASRAMAGLPAYPAAELSMLPAGC